MGYFNIFDLFENLHWRKRCRMDGDELVVQGEPGLICPHCLQEIKRAVLSGQGAVCCHCSREFELPED